MSLHRNQCKRIYVDDNILTKQYFTRPTQKRKGLETGLIAVIANSSVTLVSRASKTK
jgi:hypothetical protein